jgi:hypothetical protein
MQTTAIPYLNRSGRQVKGKYTGITLCSSCHYTLHSIYGVNVGLDNLNIFLGV